MAMCKILTVFVALVAVLVGIVGKMLPEVFLKIPHVGFIVFMLMGGNDGIVPPFFDTTAFQGDNAREWLRDGDVVVATAPKAGTTWMCYCLDAIRRKGSDDIGLPYTDIMLTTPWMEVSQEPGEKWGDRLEKYNTKILPNGHRLKDYWDNAAFKYRVFKSHYTPKGPGKQEVLPVKEMPKVKFLISARPPLEVVKSLINFFPLHTSRFRDMWGGFPPAYADEDAVMKDLLPGAPLYGFFFGYLKAWWPYRHEPNVLALHFKDMVKDVPALVDKLARFVEVTLDEEEKSRVVDKCSFQHMKENAHLFDYKLVSSTESDMTIMSPGGQINQGKSGNVVQGSSNEAAQSFNDAMEKELIDPGLRKWVLEGGEFL